MVFCGGIDLMSQHVDLTCVSQNMAVQFHPVMHNMHKLCRTVDRRLECETMVLNHDMFAVALLSKLTTTVDTAYTGEDTVETCAFEIFVDIHKSFSRQLCCVMRLLLTQISAMAALCRTSDLTPSLTI